MSKLILEALQTACAECVVLHRREQQRVSQSEELRRRHVEDVALSRRMIVAMRRWHLPTRRC